jgi:AcrR family transcriptional regulator
MVRSVSDEAVSAEVEVPTEASRREFIAAARRCFARDGIAATNMADVAREAGLSRPYLYKLFSNRVELIELAMLDRGREFSEELAARAVEAAAGDDLSEAFIDQLRRAVSLGREDPEFVVLAAAVPRERANHLFTAADSPLRGFTWSTFKPLLDRAAAEGVLRTDVSLEEVVDWLHGVVLMLAGRDDLDEAAERRLMAKFIVRGILER